MYSKTIKVLFEISKKDLYLFQKYLEQFKNKENVFLLVRHISAYYPNKDHEQLGKPFLFDAVFKNQEFNKNKISHLLSETLRQFRNYIGIKKFNENKEIVSLFQTQGVLELDLQDLLLDASSIVLDKKDFNRMNEDELKYGYELDLLNSSRFHLGFIKNKRDWPLQNSDNQLDTFYVLQKFIIASEMLNRTKILNIQYDSSMIDHLIEYLEGDGNELLNNVYIKFYYLIYMLYRYENGEVWLNSLYENIKKHGDKLSPHVLVEIFAKIKNFCIDKSLQGQDIYWSIGFKFYRKQIDMGVFVLNNKLTNIEYRNLINFALRSGKIKKAEQFLNDFIPFIHKKSRKNAFLCNHANILFYQKRFDDALSQLSRVKTEDIYYSLFVRSVTIKALYEIKELTTFQSSIQSFRNYLSRNKLLSPDQIEYYRNFVNYTYQLFILEFKSPTLTHVTFQKKIIKLEGDIKNTKKVLNRSWMLEKFQLIQDQKK